MNPEKLTLEESLDQFRCESRLTAVEMAELITSQVEGNEYYKSVLPGIRLQGRGAPTLKVYLDDERPVPEGWILARWPAEVIALLELGVVNTISLDHDLGDDVRGTGYDVLTWIEEAVSTRGFKAPEILIHTANPPAMKRMMDAVEKIKKIS